MANYSIIYQSINDTDGIGNPVTLNQLRLTFTGDVKHYWYAMASGQTVADATVDFKSKMVAQGFTLVD